MFKRFIIGLISLILIYLIVNFSRQTWKLWRSGYSVEEKQRELKVVEEENRRLQTELEKVQSPGYIEREAREKLGMSKVGEKVIVMPTLTLQETSVAHEDEPNWLKWWQLFVN